MKPKPNPLAGLVDAMKSHDNRLASNQTPTEIKPSIEVVAHTPKATPVQTVAVVEKPKNSGEKIYCAARYTRGQIAKMDQIIFLTHKERGVRLTQSDILKQAVERMPVAPLEEGEVAEIMTANGRKQLNSFTV